ncbi:putative sulfate exporter family transporter [Variovorax sp. J22P240]|uniref:YeiH family protein n=1 Tax=unclassified Variovorax TaxID=663243 RepID=UPI002576E43D|nr:MULTISPECIES: putative sulfate exporter family transporter [unclassified Variovorax]MDM0000624.1 putative sulfate exporter family transporter [Variovorax sp. J22P240]MDM0052892.1 putative sulfate exporter family transporter [Variovorax sp. J22R115]
MTTLATSVRARSNLLVPGLLMSIVVAAAATFLADHYHAPVMLFALLLGMAVNFLSADGKCKPGIEFTSREVLRVGVALLGMRLTFSQIAALGWHPVVLVVGSVILTILVAMLAARAMGFQTLFGLLTGGATAICGASAALALAAALPAHPGKERATLFTVIGVSALSTMAMIVYPMVVQLFGLDPTQAGMFLGGTIHDVAQVVGAGYGMSQQTGDTATVVKLMRVAMLLPVIVCAVMISRGRGGEQGGKRPPLLPWFAVGFIVLAALNSTGWIAPSVQTFANDLSRWCLVIAISALGMKTQLKELASVGLKPIVLMVGETVFLAALVLGLLRWGL